jgi:integrase
VDVGDAIVSYLRRRPRCESRALFLRVTAPRGALDRSTVGSIVREGCRRAGLPRVGAHRLRHTAATEMLRQGGSLPEIAQVLRHHDLKTTAQYAKVDRNELRARAPVAGGCGMTSLRTALGDYLRIRRRLGFELREEGRQLEGFVGFLEQAGATTITTELALMWAKLPVHAHPHTWRRRLGVVRGFARYLATIDPDSEVPSKDLLPATRPRVAPYIYSETEIAALMNAARQLRPPLRASRHVTLIGLLAATGVRPGEALALDRQDVDLRHGTLHVRAGKQKKQREVPLHDTTSRALGEYARQRDARFPKPGVLHLLTRTTGRPRRAQPDVSETDRSSRP